MNILAEQAEQYMASLDWIIVAGYFTIIFGVAGVVTWRQRKDATTDGYFLAGRHAGWWVIGASLFAANIGSEHLVGLAGAGANDGVAMGQFELFAVPCLLVLTWIFIPFYIKNGVFTMPEFLEKRFSSTTRWWLAGISIVAYILTKISVTICAGGLVISALTGINFWACAVIVVVGTGAYTLLGGLRVVLYTDFLQIFVILLGSGLVTWFGLSALGDGSAVEGWLQVKESAGDEFLNMWKPMDHANYPWTGIVFGIMIIGVWYWCTDQFIVQRVLSARNIDHARAGALFGGALKILPLFLFVVPGVIAFCLNKEGIINLKSADEALPTMVLGLLGPGLRGVVIAGLLAALTSSLASVFNSCSTLVTIDIYKKLHPKATEQTLVWVGRCSTLALIGVGLGWIVVMEMISEPLYQYLQMVQVWISPPIAAVFLFGVMFKRLTSKGAMAALITGLVIGIGRLALEIMAKAKVCETFMDTEYVNYIESINWLHFGVYSFIVCTLVMFAVSFFTKPKSDQELSGLTFQTGEFGLSAMAQGHTKLMLTLSVVIMAIVGVIWLYFSNLRDSIFHF